jgi:hypothetical protein
MNQSFCTPSVGCCPCESKYSEKSLGSASETVCFDLRRKFSLPTAGPVHSRMLARGLNIYAIQDELDLEQGYITQSGL